MKQVEIMVCNQRFSLACDDGQEPHLMQLADEVSDRAKKIADSQPKAKDSQILLMTCLMLADELYDARTEAGILHEKLAGEINNPPEEAPDVSQEMLPDYVAGTLSEALEEISFRLDRLSRSVESARETII